MSSNKVLEQHIAVFGESGSGKTVMLSSFYGSEQEPLNIKKGAFNVVAENASQGTHLHQNYLGMKNSGTVPEATRFASTTYRFILKFKGETEAKRLKAKPFDALRLVWHDYPGEWFEQDVSGPEEERRRIDAFRALLGSHVALLLVDGQKFLENVGEEERYLKSLLSNFRNSLVLLRDDLLEDGKPLVTFPRIWVIALSKADLLPDLDVHGFKELVIEKAGSEIVELRTVLGGLAESEAALSVGEDFVLVSSAKFSTDAIEVTQRIGIDLILPMASVLPFERHLRWAQADKLTKKVAVKLIGNAEVVAAALGAASNIVAVLMGKRNKLAGAVGLALSQLTPKLEDAIKSAGAKLEAADAAAVTKQQNLAATLDGFRKDLDEAEEKAILVRSAG
ncbi:ATP/GTP-binding protein [Nocardioides campestrisoli]|uniref:ATP/GTP-binding protein n=1 Tax=Nocardioides campestrisoli TaxID=2736757 RepID=UPI00163DB48C|nr:ATP/GTP-binding protein [Nocardioides campestrisoli]